MKRLILIIFLVSPLYGGTFPDGYQVIKLDDFSGGLFTNWPPSVIPLSFSPNLYNLFIDNGKMEKINGFITVGSSNVLVGITGIYPFYQETGVTRFLVTDSSYILDTADFKTYVLVSSGLNSSVIPRCIQVRNKMWCGNGVDNWITWDGTNYTILNGLGTTPNVPKFKYPAYYQNRVFGLNTSADGSLLSFSSLKSTDGINIAPDDSRAWPSTNQLDIGQGDGQIGTGAWVTNGILNLGKENSIYTLFGTNNSSYIDRKKESGVGVVSNDSVVTLDGNTYFVGQNGIYEDGNPNFNAANANAQINRISDHIKPDFDTFQLSTIKTLENLWETQSDFSKGNFYATTATPSGLLTIVTKDRNITPNGNFNETNPPDYTLNSGTTFYGFKQLTFAVNVDSASPSSNFRGYVGTIAARMQRNGLNDHIMRITIKNVNNNQVKASTFAVGSAPFLDWPCIYDTFVTSANPLFEGDDIRQSSMALKVEWVGSAGPDGTNAGSIDVKGFAQWSYITMHPATTGQFISEVSTLTSVTSWGNFDSIRNTNGGSLSYFLRTSTSSVNIATQTWNALVPGVRINAPTINNYAQWASTITSVSSFTTTSNIDNVTIDHVEGAGSVNRPLAIDWNNRYWLVVSTETSGKFSKIYVKSKITNKFKDAWMPILGINIKAIAKDQNRTLYGGAASTGAFYRLDNGTNFDGQAIESVYTTPDLIMDSPFKKKSILSYLVQGSRESGSNLLIGSSQDGSAYTEQTLGINGSGTYSEYIAGVTGQFNTLSIRLRNNLLDKGMSVDRLFVVYTPTEIYPAPKQ